MTKNSGVYRITSLVDGKFYIGSSINLSIRLRKHREMLTSNRHTNIHLQRIYNKYGKDNLIFEIVYKTKDTLTWEQYFIDKLKPEINIAKNAIAPMLGRKHTAKTILKMTSHPYKRGRDHPLYGKKHTEEHKKNQSKARQNIVLSEETKRKISENAKKRNALKHIDMEQFKKPIIVSNGKIYPSIKECAKELNLCEGTIINNLKGRVKLTRCGLTFKYLKENYES